jgi:hypothetical protein
VSRPSQRGEEAPGSTLGYGSFGCVMPISSTTIVGPTPELP